MSSYCLIDCMDACCCCLLPGVAGAVLARTALPADGYMPPNSVAPVDEGIEEDLGEVYPFGEAGSERALYAPTPGWTCIIPSAPAAVAAAAPLRRRDIVFSILAFPSPSSFS